ncbi:MAG: PQQ-dependent sugar dehydrogenase [Nitriliruptoraceae bacterium]
MAGSLHGVVTAAAVAALVLSACSVGADDSREGSSVPAPPESQSPGSPRPDDDPEIGDEESDDDGAADGAAPHSPTLPDLGVDVALEDVGMVAAALDALVGPDGELYVADRAGTVHMLDATGVSPPVVNLTAETTTDAERGLLGLAYPGDGSALFVSFTDTSGASRIQSIDLDTGDRRDVLRVEQPFGNHNGGGIAFGPDGMLYVGLGDGGGAGDPLGAGQDRTTLLGSILRIDPFADAPYAVPADNPFVGESGVREEIFLFGVRNPWRFSFDPATGDLWIADVGQNRWEEITRIDPVAQAGANLGWSAMEGTHEFSGTEPDGHVPPVHEYPTADGRCAVTGGVVYRGTAIAGFAGAYLYSDYCDGRIRALAVDDAGNVVDETDLGVAAGNVVAFATDTSGEVLVLSLDGRILRLVPA